MSGSVSLFSLMGSVNPVKSWIFDFKTKGFLISLEFLITAFIMYILHYLDELIRKI